MSYLQWCLRLLLCLLTVAQQEQVENESLSGIWIGLQNASTAEVPPAGLTTTLSLTTTAPGDIDVELMHRLFDVLLRPSKATWCYLQTLINSWGFLCRVLGVLVPIPIGACLQVAIQARKTVEENKERLTREGDEIIVGTRPFKDLTASQVDRVCAEPVKLMLMRWGITLEVSLIKGTCRFLIAHVLVIVSVMWLAWWRSHSTLLEASAKVFVCLHYTLYASGVLSAFSYFVVHGLLCDNKEAMMKWINLFVLPFAALRENYASTAALIKLGVKTKVIWKSSTAKLGSLVYVKSTGKMGEITGITILFNTSYYVTYLDGQKATSHGGWRPWAWHNELEFQMDAVVLCEEADDLFTVLVLDANKIESGISRQDLSVKDQSFYQSFEQQWDVALARSRVLDDIMTILALASAAEHLTVKSVCVRCMSIIVPDKAGSCQWWFFGIINPILFMGFWLCCLILEPSLWIGFAAFQCGMSAFGLVIMNTATGARFEQIDAAQIQL